METVAYLRRQRFMRDAAPLLLLPIGAVMIYVGVMVGMTCTSYLPITNYCDAHDLAVPGYGTALIGLCLALVGLGAFLARGGEEAPPREPSLRIADPLLSDRVDRDSRLVFVGLVGIGLVVAEAFPIYSLALQTMQGPNATFSPIWFAADVVLFALADAMVLLVIWAWTGTQ